MRLLVLCLVPLVLAGCAKQTPICDAYTVKRQAKLQHMVPAPFKGHSSPNCPGCPNWTAFYDRNGVCHLAFIGEYDTPYKKEFHTFVLIVRCLDNGQYERVARLDTCREHIDFLSFMPGNPDRVAVTFTAESDDVGGITLTSPPCFQMYYTEDMNNEPPLCWSQGPDGEYDWLPKKQ